MKIGEFANACGSSVRMIRFYEKLNLIRPLRNANGYRSYDEQDIDYIKKVILLNHAGLALKDIALLRTCLNDKPQHFCDNLRHKLQTRLTDIHEQMATLNQSKKLIEQLLNTEEK
ncbi:MerR family transcriptional regulator [Aggregatibacter actinomycetemcomitans]|nr:MerR family transcriptional regulator [Aggregatibacter actinomycetemcomitans]